MAWLLVVFIFVFTGLSTSSFISDDIFESHGSNGRTLLQAKTGCPVNFEFQNYTIITSQCKGPQYPAKLCCDAFKEFACPFVDYLNDLTNDCATTMFSYINLYGKYPPGVFASECREGKLGLACPANAPGISADISEGTVAADISKGTVSQPCSFTLVLTLTIGVLLVFSSMFSVYL